jgi:RNA polymerase sigma-70 factor (ECF subfamily)
MMEVALDTRTRSDSRPPVTDAEAVQRVRGGDREAYRILVVRYRDLLFRRALALVGDADTAADIVQATLVGGFAQLSKLRDDGAVAGWLYRMCTNACRDHLKSARRRDVPLQDATDAALQARERADAPLERRRLRGALLAALRQLSEEHREAFLLKHVEECSYEEMSKLLGASVPALKMRVHRARDALRSALDGVL